MAAGLPTLVSLNARTRATSGLPTLRARHIWHTHRNEPICASQVPLITDSMLRAARRTRSAVLAQAVLSDHVHLLIRCAPDAMVSAFVREAKSESSRRVGRTLQWQRGYFADSISPSHVIIVRRYIASQLAHHPDKIPPG